MKKQRTRLLCLMLALCLCLSGAALAAEPEEEPTAEDGVYVLMNVPYAEFYAAEGVVDAVSSATLNGKARNVNVNGASYHRSEEAVSTEGIAGATFPVFATLEDLAALGGQEITDESLVTYDMTARGTTTTVELRGADALQEAPDYSYYVLSEKPASFKKLTVADGAASFTAAGGSAAAGETAGEITVGARHADIEIKLTGVEVEPKAVSAVVVTAGEEKYALHHVVNVWRGTEIGWNLSDLPLGGKTITNVRYYLKDGSMTDYAAELVIPDAAYVLMNVPYAEFYAAELGENGSVDAVSSATLKYANSGIAGGSYHETDAAEGAEVTALGATYPVFVPDMSLLDESLQVTDETAKTIGIVSGREKTITPTEVSGRDALFCAPSYSWYALAEKPARYKALSAAEDGSFTFGAVSGRAAALEDVTAAVSYYTHHGNYIEIRLGGVTIEEPVNGVVVTFADGSETALPVIQGFWQKTQLGWADNTVAGKTITALKFVTAENVYTAAVEVPVKLDGGQITAVFEDADTLTVTGLPADAANPVATVQTVVGRGETPTVIAENAAVEDGRITTADHAVAGMTYTVVITSDNYADLSASAEFSVSEGEEFLSRVKGIYQPLFEGATFNEEYDHYWHDYTAAVVGASAADDVVAYMKSSIGAQGYGENAEAPNFFCGFTGDVASITFGGEDGKTVTYTKTDGSSVTYTYAFVGESAATGSYGEYQMEMPGYLYETADPDAGIFRYLLMFPDTPDTTYHLEFRYADTKANAENLLEGPYAYWVGSAIQSVALTEENEDTLQKVISLFVVENLVGMVSDETAAQRAGLVGTWDCDFSAFPDYADAKMYIVLSADGSGKTYADFTGAGELSLTAAYTFFAYDPDPTDGKNAGTYISLNPSAETVTPGEYEVTEIKGKKALVFTSNEGVITYYLRKETPVTPVTPVIPVTPITPTEPKQKLFEDVKDESAYYFKPVYWAVEKGIAAGRDGTHFDPEGSATRAEMLTFLWRAAGSPTSAIREHPFTDVETGSYYEQAVLWAWENGVTLGMDETHFGPSLTVTRGQTLTFLFRALKIASAEGTEPFEDVNEGAYYYRPVLWAIRERLTTGVDETHFAPMSACRRADIVTFLYRFYAK